MAMTKHTKQVPIPIRTTGAMTGEMEIVIIMTKPGEIVMEIGRMAGLKAGDIETTLIGECTVIFMNRNGKDPGLEYLLAFDITRI